MRRLCVFMPILFLIALTLYPNPARAVNFIVSDCANFTGTGTISQAIADAAANASADTISFTCSAPIDFGGQLTISDNVTINGGGNIIFNGGGLTRFFTVMSGASLTLDSLTLQNGASSNGGGAILSLGNSLTIINSTFSNNSALGSNHGGVIDNSNGTITITNSTFSNNSTVGGNGGVINSSNGTITITNSTFTGNQAGARGGAIYQIGTSSLNITGSSFSNNSAREGGAVYHRASTLNIDKSTFYDNSATAPLGNGGAVYLFTGSSINQSTFHNNTAVAGGAIYNGNTNLSAVHLTLVNNTATTGGAVENTLSGTGGVIKSIITGTGNQCNNTSGSFLIDTSSITDGTCGGATTTTNLLLGTFNGTIVPLLAGSPAIDLVGFCSFFSDQIGTLLPQGTGCDAGAVEFIFANLTATSVCIGTALQVNILTGDAPFQVTANSVILANNLGLGTHTITGFGTQTGVNVTELSGDTQNFLLGDIDCTPNNLSASAVCVGNDLYITIGNGEAPFQITANSVVFATGLSAGLHIIPNAGVQTGVSVSELAGDTQNFPLGNFNCVGSVTPPAIPTTSTVTVLGCALDTTDGVEVAGAPDNTYCRILMKNGGVVSYSGAIPADLIGLGVILAVDVYRLEGGATVNTFPDYARVCLSGSGRLFYMDGRNAPRFSVELASESVDGLTCGWIPAPGTLILTN